MQSKLVTDVRAGRNTARGSVRRSGEVEAASCVRHNTWKSRNQGKQWLQSSLLEPELGLTWLGMCDSTGLQASGLRHR